MIRRILWGLILTAFAVPAAAQDAPALVEYYGDGVHAYFEGDIFEAHRLFTQAIDGGIQDPRAYYFRAMTLMGMNRTPEAQADMQAGAYLEARAPSGAYDVDRSIQRIQGRHRLLLEKIRRQVRYNVQQERQQEEARRYEETRRREAEVLRRQRPPTYDEAVEPAGGAQDAATGDPADGAPTPETTLTSPSGDSAIPQPSTREAPPAQPQPERGPQPTDQPAEQEPEADDPFGGAFDTPDEEPASEAGQIEVGQIEVGQKVPATKLLDVLGGLVGNALEDTVSNAMQNIPGGGMGQPPFGAGAEPAEPPGSDPFGGGEDPFGGQADPFGGQADPFGSDGQTGTDNVPLGGDDPFGAADEPGQANESPAQEDDPFGGTTDAADPFGGDPFGAAQDDAEAEPAGDNGDSPFN